MMATCIAYTRDGRLCGRPAAYFDEARGGMLCEACAREAGLPVAREVVRLTALPPGTGTPAEPDAEGEEGPAARLRAIGPEALSSAELVALVLASGRPGRPPRALAEALLQRFGSLRGLSVRTIAELTTERGMGFSRAAVLVATFEIGRRVAETRLTPGTHLGSSTDVFRHCHLRLRDLKRECFLALLLDIRHRLIREVRISDGTLTASLVHPREAFVVPVRESAAAVVVVHNHPSGDPRPSPEDVDLTRRLVQVGHLLGIPVLDYVVMGEGRHYSFADAGRL